ncbi:hypothetical protein UFOVP1439_23 [uncultured Caudovirales phage]|uniref:Uncharacterized protein n=1 Tax=uncultured Caudovirales phage TaxID=2100421 RepID=A0A6J5QJ44_9CAUD|nr:hypothetical protein UFOVP1085_3 [uncultured Caudovirales phage]CAB4212549.1 hypothetical protein UFOVP1439_23 [uncultured Caudovirales phage]
MSEFPKPEQLSRRERSRAARVSDIIRVLSDRHYIEPIEPIEPIGPTEPAIQDVHKGWGTDADLSRVMPHRKDGIVDETHPGYHVSVFLPKIERPDAGQLDKTTRNWDVV